MSDILTIEQLTERRSSRSDFVEVHEIIASREALRKERDIANAKLLETTKRLAHMSVDLAAAERVVEAVNDWEAFGVADKYQLRGMDALTMLRLISSGIKHGESPEEEYATCARCGRARINCQC